MRPLFAAKYLTDGFAPDPKRVGYPLVGGGPGHAANLAHNVVGQFVPVMALPFVLPLNHHIAEIGGAGIPSQIGKPVVAGVPVVVASLAPGGAGADERRKNQSVNVVGLVNVAGESEDNNLTPEGVIGAGAQCPPISVPPLVFEAGQDSAVCAGGISGISGDARVSNLSAVFWEWGECIGSHVSDYTTHGPECAI